MARGSVMSRSSRPTNIQRSADPAHDKRKCRPNWPSAPVAMMVLPLIVLSVIVRVIIEQLIRFGQTGVTGIFRRQGHPVAIDMPVYGQLRIVPCNTALALGGVESVALILNRRPVAKHRETVCEPARDEYLASVVCG